LRVNVEGDQRFILNNEDRSTRQQEAPLPNRPSLPDGAVSRRYLIHVWKWLRLRKQMTFAVTVLATLAVAACCRSGLAGMGYAPVILVGVGLLLIGSPAGRCYLAGLLISLMAM
jgi:hypothetical protein